jgi:hypothetical protein
MASDYRLHDDAADEGAAVLIRRLHETEQKLRALTGDEVDAVIHPLGTPYLLYQAQRRLLDSEAAQRELALRHLKRSSCTYCFVGSGGRDRLGQ